VKLPPLRNLTPAQCEHIRVQMRDACAEIAGQHGLIADEATIWNVNLGSGFELRLQIGIALSDGTLFSPERALFEVLAQDFGLQPSDFHRIFIRNGETYRITGVNPNRPRYPISTQRIPDGRGFKFTAKDVALYLAAFEE
jgi:hypothetical protein